MILAYLIPVILAYLLGSLTFSIWTGKLFFRVDVREHGSGNAGATNTWRVLGWKAGLPVLLLDVGKGFASTRIPFLFLSFESDPATLQWLQIICGVIAAIGHIYPVFAGFRGGKGVSTLLGIVLGLMPVAAICCLGVFLVTFLLFRYVSLGSIVAALLLPVFVFILGDPGLTPLHLLAMLIAVVVLLTHRRNLGRLMRREETKMILFRKRS